MDPTIAGEVVTPAGPVHRELEWIPGRFAVCRLDPRKEIPAWAIHADGLVSITRTDRELSIIMPEDLVPDGVQSERGWVAMRVTGTMGFGLVGVLARLTRALEAGGVAALAISTYDTDTLLVKSNYSRQAVDALRAAGYEVLA